jgi:putative ABC transport system substrate-binding protein
MKRREFINLLGSAVAMWPLGAHAQQPARMRRVGALMNLAADDPESLLRVTALVQRLAELGWTVGRNLQIDYRWGADGDLARRYAAELVALAPDVILTHGGGGVRELQLITRTVPIVFVSVVDPVSAGYAASLARPGGNSTGFTALEFGFSGKWLELLKAIAPRTTRVAVLRDPSLVGAGQIGAIQSVAPSFGVELTPVSVRDAGEIERAIAAFAHGSNDGLIVTVSTAAVVNRETILALAARHRLPAVYPYRYFASGGGLVSYGPEQVDQYRQAAGYVDRILKGVKPADLPVQAPVKYETVFNLKTAKALGLDVPATVFARVDEVIE